MKAIGFMVLSGIIYMALMYALIYVNKRISDSWAKRSGISVDYCIEEESNLALGLSRAGLYLGLAIGMFGVIAGPTAGFVNDLYAILAYGALVSLFFVGARVFNDRVLLGYIPTTGKAGRTNLAIGFVELGSYLATGVIAMSSMMGTGGGFASAVGFFLFGQLLLLVVMSLYEFITPWNLRQEIASGNPAAGLLLGGVMAAMAVALHGAIATDFVSWQTNLSILAVEGTIAVALMLLLSKVVDWLFLPGTDLQTEVVRDRNYAAVTVVVAMKMVGALAISAAVV